MKLRIRSMATKETIRVSTPDNSSLLDLKTVIAITLASNSPNPIPILPVAIHLSLNQTDELVAPNPSDTLSSLGLTSGDLIFYSYFPFPQTLAHSNPSVALNSMPVVSNSGTNSSSNNPAGSSENITTAEPGLFGQSSGPMEVDVNPVVPQETENTQFIRQFLVELMDTVTGDDASISARVVMLTHAAMRDTGFTLLNGSGSNLPLGWASQISSLRLMYTLPDFVDQVRATDDKVAVLKFSVLGNMVIVYGYMGGVKPDFYHFCFDLSKFTTLFGFNLNSLSKSEKGKLMEVFHRVKDRISLPLMIDFSLKNGLPLPSCFMSLPIDMKTKIMDLLLGDEAVRMGSTCKELWNLSLDENLWRQKAEREYSSYLTDNSVISAGTWRERYKRAYTAKKNELQFLQRPRYTYRTSSRRCRLGQPFYICGDFGRFPAFGGGFGEASLGYPRRIGGMASPRCNFGRFI